MKFRPALFAMYTAGILCLYARPVTSVQNSNPNRKAWHLLIDNDVMAARELFAQNTKSENPAIAGEAYRGLAVVKNLLGASLDAASMTFRAFLADQDTTMLDAAWINALAFARSGAGSKLKEGYNALRMLAGAPGRFNGEYRATLVQRLVNDGKLSAARGHADALGIVRTFRMIGPFENISGSGYRKIYPPETEIRFDAVYTGKNLSQTRWFPYDNHDPVGWVFTENNFDDYNAVTYYYANVKSDVTREAWIGFGASGAFKVFLNDNLTLADSIFRNTGADMFMRKVRLFAGDNKLLVKLAHEEKFANFLIRFMDENGRPIKGLRYSRENGDFKQDKTRYEDLCPSPAVRRTVHYLSARLAKDSADHEAALHLMTFYNASELTDRGQELARRFLRRHPRSSLWRALYSESLQRGRKMTDAVAELRTAYRLCPLNANAWENELQTLASSANPRDVIAFIEASPEPFRTSAGTLVTLFGNYAQLGDEAKALEVLGILEREHAENTVVAMLLAQYHSKQGRGKQAVALLEKLAKNQRYAPEIYNQIAELYMAMGRPSKGIAALETCIRYTPNSPGAYQILARLAMQSGQHQRALQRLNQALAIMPTSSELLNLKGAVLIASGNAPEAAEALASAISFDYNNFAAWDQLLPLTGGRSPMTLVDLPDPDTLIAYGAFWPGLDSDNGSMLAYYKDVFLYPSRCSRERTFLVVHLPTQSAIDNWKEYSISYNGYYQRLDISRAYTRSASGRETPADINRNDIVFKTLAPGDYIVMEWTLENYYTGDMAGHVWGEHSFSLHYPVYKSALRLIAPVADSIPYTVNGDSVQTRSVTEDGFRVTAHYRDPYENPPSEGYMLIDPPWRERVSWSTLRSWSQVAQWYCNLTENRVEQTAELKAAADSLFALAASRRDTIARVQQYITDAIRYSFVPFRQSAWVPQPAREVLATRIGDCKDMASLGKSFLDYAGIPAALALVNTRDRNSVYPSFIGPNFNHCILSYTIDGVREYCDLTDDNLSLGSLPQMDQGALALIISRNSDSLIHLPHDHSRKRKTRRAIVSRIDSSGTLIREVSSLRTGVSAANIRSAYRFFAPRERKKNLQQALAEDFPEIRIDSMSFSGLDSLSDSLSYFYRYTARNAVTFTGNAALVALRLPDRITGDHFPSDERRGYDIDMNHAWFNIGEFTIKGTLKIPRGWRLISEPEPIFVKGEGIAYSLSIEHENDIIHYKRRAIFELTKPVLAKESATLRKLLAQVARADNVYLMFYTE